MATIPNTNLSPLREAIEARNEAMLTMRYRTLGKISFLYTDEARVDSRKGITEGVIDYRRRGPGLALAHGRRGDMLLIIGEWETLPDVVKPGSVTPCTACLAECDECGIAGAPLGMRPCLNCGARLRFRPDQKCKECAGTGYAGRMLQAERENLGKKGPLPAESDDDDRLGIRCSACNGSGHIGEPDQILGRKGCRVCKGKGLQECGTCQGSGKVATGYARGKRRRPGYPEPQTCGKCQGNRVTVGMIPQPWKQFENGLLEGYMTYGPIQKIMFHQGGQVNSLDIAPDRNGNLAVLLVDQQNNRQYIIGGTIRMRENPEDGR